MQINLDGYAKHVLDTRCRFFVCRDSGNRLRLLQSKDDALIHGGKLIDAFDDKGKHVMSIKNLKDVSYSEGNAP